MKKLIALLMLFALPAMAQQKPIFYDYATGQILTITNEVGNTNTVFGSINIGNLSISSAGITVTNAYQHEDLRFPASAVKAGTVNPPTFEQMNAEIFSYNFSKSQEQDIHMAAQLPHTWDVGTIAPHLHLSNGTYTNGGTSVWQMVWWPADIMAKFPAVVYTNTVTNVWPKGAGTEWTHTYTNFPAISAATHGLTNKSAMIMINLARKVGDPADTADEKEWYLEFDIHYNIKYVTGR